jgi:MFS family permease
MHMIFRVHKILHMKKELKEVYANQVIETLALFMIGIFIPAFLIESGFTFIQAAGFMIMQWGFYAITVPLSGKISSRIGVKHTILLRSPILIAYLAMVMNMGSFPWLYSSAAILGGMSLSLYWVSINTEYVRTSDKKSEGEEAGMFFGLPHLSAAAGPLIGAAVLTVLGFPVLFVISVVLILLSVAPLFLSDDYRSSDFGMKGIDLLMDRRRAVFYLALGIVYSADFVFWPLHIYMNSGLVILGLAASLTGVGMIVFTLMVGKASNTTRGRRRVTRIGAFLLAVLWILRLLADSDMEFLVLSLMGGFIITSVYISLYADFAKFAKKNGAGRTVVFRQFWAATGHFLPFMILAVTMPGTGEFLGAAFIISALASLVLIAFRE